jgi:hypothetical protein
MLLFNGTPVGFDHSSDLVGVLLTKSFLRDVGCPFVFFVPSW